MSSDDTDEGPVDGTDDRDESLEGPADFVETDAEDPGRRPAVEELDQRIVDLLSWILDTETRAKIYVYLLANPGSTSEEVAKGTGLYPSTVREALAELHDEERVTREKRASEGAGNNPYEYTAIQPSDLVGGVADQVQRELNTIFTLDRVLDRESDREPRAELEEDVEPVKITVDDTAPTLGDEPASDDEPETDDDADVIEFEDDVQIDTVDTEADESADDESDDSETGTADE
ncbi:helix-turn-helix domain-containing protein [Natrinema sp. 1APR25-10V2]|uniref:helix-turn-helix domain-containing protein n=1 Tax=Natrinema sp. 1APR25-10V2 TaxID=2951081 RepID=UPI002875EF13|nr:helix-turn-helix domain-containing protein [Natrinema sp. 1APR25-10V2]MDS0477935.1 helix-turn-helix domain-containing protein [Natrinema sp. 1APR25-10V2]